MRLSIAYILKYSGFSLYRVYIATNSKYYFKSLIDKW